MQIRNPNETINCIYLETKYDVSLQIGRVINLRHENARSVCAKNTKNRRVMLRSCSYPSYSTELQLRPIFLHRKTVKLLLLLKRKSRVRPNM